MRKGSSSIIYTLLKWYNRLRHNCFRSLALYEPITHSRYRLTPVYVARSQSPKTIISLTSYPARFEQLHLTLMTLISQRTHPDLIRLNLDQGTACLLSKKCRDIIQRYKIEAVEIPFKMGSYSKLIPTLSDYPKSTIITADDDIFYPRNWSRNLFKAQQDFPKHTVGYRAHKIKYDAGGKPLPYSAWEGSLKTPTSGPDVVLTGVAGILYPNGAVPSEATRAEQFTNIAPTADDLWFWRMTLLAGWVPMKIGPKTYNYGWKKNNHASLSEVNVKQGGNDRALRNILNGYPFS